MVVEFTISFGQPFIDFDHIFVEMLMDGADFRERESFFFGINNGAMGNVAFIGKFNSHDEGADSDVAALSDDGVMHDGFKSNKSTIANVTRAMH